MTPLEFAKLAAVEDRMWYFRALHGHVHRELRRCLGSAAPISLTDAGCGTGGWLRRLAQWERQWTTQGFDPATEACRLASAKGGVRVAQGSLERPPQGWVPSHVVTCLDVLYMVPKVEDALDGLARLCQPGGLVVVTAPAYMWLWSYHDEAVGGRRRFRRSALAAQMRAAGLVPIRATYWNSITFPLIAIKRKCFPVRRGEGDVQLGPRWLEAGLNGLMTLEGHWLAAGGTLAVGASVLIVARRV